jgi:hypothetical protein
LFTETHPCALYKIPVRLAPLGIVGVGFIYFSPHPVSSKRKSRAGRRRFVLTTELRLCLFPAHRLSSSCMLEPRRPSPPPLPAPWLGFVRSRRRCGPIVLPVCGWSGAVWHHRGVANQGAESLGHLVSSPASIPRPSRWSTEGKPPQQIRASPWAVSGVD